MIQLINNFEYRSGNDDTHEETASEDNMQALSNDGDDEYLDWKAEIGRKYDASKGPYKHIKILTEQLVESPDKSDSEWGK